MYAPRYDLSRLGVICVVSNPVRYRSQYEQYYRFSNNMARAGVKLFTIECVFESATSFGLPPQRFEVTRPNNPYHFQVIAPTVIWLKENLINVAVQRLPAYIDRIAWIDTDVEFERLDWPHLTMAALDRYPIVQMFKTGYFTGPGGIHEVLNGYRSVGYAIRHGRPIQMNHPQWYAHPGYAWAMHRNIYVDIGGLMDFCIVGSSDLPLALALLGRVEETFPSGLHKDYRSLAMSWGNRVAKIAGGGARVGYVDVNLYRHWRGYRSNRSYVGRWSILMQHQFSPKKDLKRDNSSGVIYLADKRNFGLRSKTARIVNMERAIVNYFVSRNEDNTRFLPGVPMPGYHPPPAFHRRRFHPFYTSGGHYRPAVPMLPHVTPRRSRRSGLYQPLLYY